MKNLAVFASGSGTNLQAIATYFLQKNHFPLKLVVCDKLHAPVIQRAAQFGIRVVVVDYARHGSRQQAEEEILGELRQESIDLIALAGYMRLLGPTLLTAYPGKIINIHPSLLPAFPGKDGVGQALAYGVKLTGVTIHFVDQGMDTGPILYQAALPVKQGDSYETLRERINQKEWKCYPKIIDDCLQDRIVLTGSNIALRSTEGRVH